jgi:glycosyltransferase involved in cell wall biosynthesis
MEFCREAGVPALLEVNAPLIEEQAKYRVLVDRLAAEQVAERVFAAATAILAVSDEVARWLERFPATHRKVRVVPNGIRPERFPGGTAPSAAVPGVFTIGFVGTLKAWHGLAVLVEAFAAFHRRHANSRLLIVGDGPERERVEADLGNRGLREVALLTGAVPPAEVPGLLASMDVAVAPYPALTDFYFSPLKVYEYMAAERPVIASRIGQLQKLIQPGFNGVLVTPGDAAELAEALEKLFRDPPIRSRLGREARRTVLRKHTWDSVLQTILELAGLKATVPPVCAAPG